MMKLILVLCNFANVPKTAKLRKLCVLAHCTGESTCHGYAGAADVFADTKLLPHVVKPASSSAGQLFGLEEQIPINNAITGGGDQRNVSVQLGLSCLLCVCRGPPFCQEDSLMLHVFHA
jgi:hypothetical protein